MYKGEINDIKIIRDEYIIEVFVNCGEQIYTAVVKRIPFDVSIDPFYTESNMIALAESKNELEANKIVVKTIEDLEGLANE